MKPLDDPMAKRIEGPYHSRESEVHVVAKHVEYGSAEFQRSDLDVGTLVIPMHRVEEDGPNSVHHVIEFCGGKPLQNQNINERFENQLQTHRAKSLPKAVGSRSPWRRTTS